MPTHEARSERIEIRTTPSNKALLLRAATSSQKNVTEFLLEAGLHAAEEALVDRSLFLLDDTEYIPNIIYEQRTNELRGCLREHGPVQELFAAASKTMRDIVQPGDATNNGMTSSRRHRLALS